MTLKHLPLRILLLGFGNHYFNWFVRKAPFPTILLAILVVQTGLPVGTMRKNLIFLKRLKIKIKVLKLWLFRVISFLEFHGLDHEKKPWPVVPRASLNYNKTNAQGAAADKIRAINSS